MVNFFRKLYHPELFQGNLNRKMYFEGWYFKLVSPAGFRCAFIPGVSLNKKDSHSFIQYIDGKTGETNYFRYPLSAFSAHTKKMEIRVGDSVFSKEGIKPIINTGDTSIQGEIRFSELSPLPSTLLYPGIMGWYSFVPFMQCYHGLVSLDHHLQGELSFSGSAVDFSQGKGYIEKDWGSSMPSSWIWLQSNNFEGKIASVMFSLANIPWLGRSFDGFLCVLLLEKRILRFATYTGARITNIENSEKEIRLTLMDKNYKLSLRVNRKHSGVLAAPVFGEMSRSIHESIDSEIDVELCDLKTGAVFVGKGIHAGCEVVGEPF